MLPPATRITAAPGRPRYVGQGWRVTDPEALAQLDLPGHKTAVEVPVDVPSAVRQADTWMPRGAAGRDDSRRSGVTRCGDQGRPAHRGDARWGGGAQCLPGGGYPQLAWALDETAGLLVPGDRPPPYVLLIT